MPSAEGSPQVISLDISKRPQSSKKARNIDRARQGGGRVSKESVLILDSVLPENETLGKKSPVMKTQNSNTYECGVRILWQHVLSDRASWLLAHGSQVISATSGTGGFGGYIFVWPK